MRITDQEYQEIKAKIANGMSAKKATGTPARRIQYSRMRKKRGDAPPVQSQQATVADVIREATIAANIEPSPAPSPVPSPVPSPEPFSVLTPVPSISHVMDFHNFLPVETRELLEVTKRVIHQQLLQTAYPAPAWAKLAFELCEKELPEWRNKNTKAVKDQYEAILESVVKKSTGFQILERKGNATNDNGGDVSEDGSH